MLVPAILYGDEIRDKIARYVYSDDMLYYSGGKACGSSGAENCA